VHFVEPGVLAMLLRYYLDCHDCFLDRMVRFIVLRALNDKSTTHARLTLAAASSCGSGMAAISLRMMSSVLMPSASA
jgi:hypothetical protein